MKGEEKMQKNSPRGQIWGREKKERKKTAMAENQTTPVEKKKIVRKML